MTPEKGEGMGTKQDADLLALLALFALCAWASAGEVPPELFGIIQAGDARVALLRDGRFSLACGDKLLISEARIVIAGVGWKGAGNQATCRLLNGYPTKDGASFVFRGEIDEPASGASWRFEQRVARAGKAIHFAYQIEPLADTKAAEVSLHIMAWEFWNEINCVWGYRKRSQDVMNWTAEMGRYLRKIDPWRHLVVNSLGSFLVDDRLWKLPEMDFTQVHGYWHPTNPASKEMGKDMAEFVPHWIGRIRRFGKPALFAEFGLVNPRWGHSPRAEDDKDGVHLHNGLWSSVMSGAAGTAMLWWWGNYVDPQDLYYHFAAVASFVEGVPWTTAGFRPARVSTDSPRLRALGLRGRNLVLLWLQNRAHTWWNVVEKRPIHPLDAATVTVSGLKDGTYQVEWWDTWKGVVTQREDRQAQQGALSLAVARLRRDVAVKITRH